MADRRPWVHGLSSDDCFNLRKKWFKWDDLIHTWTKIRGYPKGDFGYTDKEKLSEEQKAEVEIVASFVNVIEDVIMEELFAFGNSFDSSLAQMNSYIDGLLDGGRHVVNVSEEGQFDD